MNSMRKTKFFILSTLIISLAFAMQVQAQSVFSKIASNPQLQEFEEAIVRAGLQSQFSGQGTFSIFAPTNDVFPPLGGNLTQAQVRDIVLTHCVEGYYKVDHLVNGFSISTMNQRNLTVQKNGNGIFINGAKMTQGDIFGTNGIVHIINDWIPKNTTSPTTVMSLIRNSTKHIILETIIDNADLADEFEGGANKTVFAPSDDAFNALSSSRLNQLLGSNKNFIENYIFFHVVNGLIRKDDFKNGPLTAANGQTLTISININGTFVNNVKVGFAGLEATNGILYTINKVLIPAPIPEFTIYDFIEQSDEHTLLKTFTDASGLRPTLDSQTPSRTFFAPTDDAFELLDDSFLNALNDDPQGLLRNVLNNHLLSGKHYVEDLLDDEMRNAVNMYQHIYDIMQNAVFVNNARITMADVEVDNGLVHVIDVVLLDGANRFTVNDILEETTSLSNFNNYVIQSNVDSILDLDGPFTVFAPSNNALAALPIDIRNELNSGDVNLIMDFVLNHVTNTGTTSSILTNDLNLTTLNGFSIKVSVDNNNNITINESRLIVRDLFADNGIVHILDTALFPEQVPETIYEYISLNDNHSILKTAVDRAGLQFIYDGDGPLTFCAPTNEAINNLPQAMRDAIFTGPIDELVDLLLGHTINDEFLQADLIAAGQVPNVNFEFLDITQLNNQVFVNNARIEVPDIRFNNGLVHVIDAVIIQPQEKNTILDVVNNSAVHTELAANIELAGLNEYFDLENPLTLFAPTDNAFNAIPLPVLTEYLNDPGGQLRDLILSHTHEGLLERTDISNGMVIDMADGSQTIIDIRQGTVFINDVRVTLFDLEADNGVVHVLDAVILPEIETTSVYDIISEDDDYSILKDAVDAAGLQDELADLNSTLTLFAPTNDAFDQLPTETVDELFADPMGSLRDLLLYHLFDHRLATSGMFNELEIVMSNGASVTIFDRFDGFYVNDAKIEIEDIQADNGLVHALSSVIMPLETRVTVYDIISSDEELSTLKSVVDLAEQDVMLREDELVTLFAPTDAAFDALDPAFLDQLMNDPFGMLNDLLLFHQFDGLILTSFMYDGLNISMANGSSVAVSFRPDGIYINESKIIVEDIVTDNGVVHVIDRVIMRNVERNTIYDIVSTNSNLTTLKEVIDLAGLNTSLEEDDNITVFAPTDNAFDALPQAELDALLDDPNGSLRTLLLNHTHNGELFFPDLSAGRVLTMQGGLEAKINIRADGLYINDAKFLIFEIRADNGIVHIIDAIIEEPAERNTVYDIIQDSDDHTILEFAVDVAGLQNNLTSEDDITIFAPTDDAFNALPADMLSDLLADPSGILQQLLLYHSYDGLLLSANLTDGRKFTMLNGLQVEIDIRAEGIFVNNARIILEDLVADNGVVHVIDAVIEEPAEAFTVYDVIRNSTDHTIMKFAIDAAKLRTSLNTDDNLTVFAPTDDAFNNLPSSVLNALLSDPQGALRKALLYHVYDDELFANDLTDGLKITMLNGLEVEVEIKAEGIFVNDALIILEDLQADNGVVHVVDAVVMEKTSSTRTFDELEFSVYPNPVLDRLYIQSVSNIDQVRVYNTSGQLMIISRDLQNGLDVADWEPGVYYMFANEQTSNAFRFVKID